MVCNDGKNNGFVLSDPATPQYIFKNRLHTNLIHRFVEEATVKGTWFSYQWKNPLTQKPVVKHAYVIRIPAQKICLGSGYYDA